MSYTTSDNYLIKKWKYLENQYLANKIETMIPKINSHCPESFTKSNRDNSRKRRQYNADSNILIISVYNFEKKKNNLILFQKLSEIYTKPSNSNITNSRIYYSTISS